MRYLLALTSLSILATFSILLATAEEPSAKVESIGPQSSEKITTTVTETQKKMETANKEMVGDKCIDGKGVTHLKGKEGYAACLKTMKKEQKRLHQMGGEAAPEENPNRSDMY